MVSNSSTNLLKKDRDALRRIARLHFPLHIFLENSLKRRHRWMTTYERTTSFAQYHRGGKKLFGRYYLLISELSKMALEYPLLGLERKPRGVTRSGRQNRSIPFLLLSMNISIDTSKELLKKQDIYGKK